MSAPRKELRGALCRYTIDTLIYIDTVRKFCQSISKWVLGRESELKRLRDIKERADRINLGIGHVTKSESKGKAFVEYMKSTNSTREELENELTAVLKDTLLELKKLHCFLDAVERLAVTSLSVFSEEGKVVFHLPKGVGPDDIQVAIAAARQTCPLLLKFKRDAAVFFFPKLQNVEVLANQLERYIQTTQRICGMMEKSTVSDFDLKMTKKTEVDLSVDLSEDEVQRMLDHIKQLDDIRMNQHFRLVYLFLDKFCSSFLDEFNKRRPQMLQFLDELEESAVQLDRMNKGAKISSVVGSSVGAVGGVLSIIGLALIPVTAGVSLGLNMAGLGLGITSGVNSMVTTTTEIEVNQTQRERADGVFKRFMEDVQSIQNCLDEASSQTVVAQEGKALRNVPRVAADIPDLGQAAVKGPLALSKSSRAGFIVLNALFLGMDVFFICKDSISLSKGSETEVSQIIRARAALWRSEIDAWGNICDSLCEGLQMSEKNKALLDMPFIQS
ncbi:uncharacterized protein LOC122966125 isoform X1 [Xyrichtys novacula]|uniref:Uncharacterized protein LOC122966125 isoform X1 n=1 Tax=Xyrichtys novacula TaxID=13765 RepID=A0AAV1F398_XYRNO|nr:uncharacterized protein LOC122966125 isoform X1 [Xyrichtys novacula]